MLVGFLKFSHGFELMEDNIHDQDEPLHSEMVMLRARGVHDFTLDPTITSIMGTLL
jgi:hypothetical protein